jgi:hypothetical protein
VNERNTKWQLEIKGVLGDDSLQQFSPMVHAIQGSTDETEKHIFPDAGARHCGNGHRSPSLSDHAVWHSRIWNRAL